MDIERITELVNAHMYEFLEVWTPWIMIAMGFITILAEAGLGLKAKYGRYVSPGNIGLKAPIAWLLQECPSFLIPLGLILYRQPHLFDGLGQLNSNLIVLAYFMIHYFNRYAIV